MFTIASLAQSTALFKIATEVGILKTLLTGIIILSFWFGIKFIGQYKFNKKAEKTGIKISDESDLRNNALFTKGNYFLNYEVPNILVFTDKPVRRELVIDLLLSHFTSILEGCKEISEVDMADWSSDQWTMEMTSRFNGMLFGANNKCRNEGMPEVAIQRFSRWVAPSIELVYTFIGTIGSSNAYASNVVKTNTLFLIINVLFNTMIGDAERSIHSLNGDITGTVYKGKIVEEVEH